MTSESQSVAAANDPAAVFACAISLWQACHKYATSHQEFNLSDCFNGIDQLMREVMAIGYRFEEWSCAHVNFDELSEVWPYFLEEEFGEACLDCLCPDALPTFGEADCLSIALKLRLPVVIDDALAVPLDLTVANLSAGAGFKEFRIQTVREFLADGEIVPFVVGDDPFDDNFRERYFALYGVNEDGKLEHIADRRTYSNARSLVQKLVPGINFPESPTFSQNHN